MTFFGPETPTPFCVSTEKHLSTKLDNMFRDNLKKHRLKEEQNRYDEIDAKNLLDSERFFCALVNKYLDIDCDDAILFMKPERSERAWSHYDYTSQLQNWPNIIERKFCLIKPVDVCEVRFFHEEKSLKNDLIYGEKKPAKFELIFPEMNNTKKYDKIIIKNCLKYFESNHSNFNQTIMSLFKKQTQTRTSLLIIQRLCDLNTLPFHSELNTEWKLADVKYTDFMQKMQNDFFAIKFDIENLKYTIDCKSTWFRHLNERTIYPLMSEKSPLLARDNEQTLRKPAELTGAIRELNEGVFKYQEVDDYVELNDRLLFIGAHLVHDRQAVLAQRFKGMKHLSSALGELDGRKDSEVDRELKQLSLEITPDLRPFVNSSNFNRKK